MAFPDEILNTAMSMSTQITVDRSTIFDRASSSSFGFNDILSTVKDYSTPTFFDWIHTFTTDAENPDDNHLLLPSPASSDFSCSSEVQQNTQISPAPAAASPNSFSISASWNEAAAPNENQQESVKDHEEVRVEGGDGGKCDDQNEDKTKQQSYYRCTTIGCNARKRVEPSPEDFSVIITTYEGNHNHPSTATSRSTHNHMHEGGCSALNNFMRATGSGGSLNYFMNVQLQQASNLFHQKDLQQAALQFHQQKQNVPQAAAAPLRNYMNSTTPFSSFVQDQNHGGFGIGPSNSSIHEVNLLRNDGLLEDILVPNQMRMRGGQGLI